MISKYAPNQKKICIVCNNEFYPTNGRAQTCSRKCSYERHKVYSKKYQQEHLDKVAIWNRKWRQKNKELIRKYSKEKYKKHKARINLRDKTRYLLKKYNIKKEGICPSCNQYKDLEIHHLTYTRDDFILICKECHLKRHKKLLRLK